MKHYIQNEGYVPVGHGRPDFAGCLPFLVTVKNEGSSRSFLVMAPDENEARARLTANVIAMKDAIKAKLSPADLLSTMEIEVDSENLRLADELVGNINRAEDKLIELEDRTDDLAETHRETLRETITNSQAQIKELRKGVSTPQPSKFDQMCARLAPLVSHESTITVTQLGNDRVYSVAYFDDPRDYVAHVQ